MKKNMKIDHYLVELENGAQYHILGKDIRDVLDQCIRNTPDIAVSLIFKKVWRNTEDEC